MLRRWKKIADAIVAVAPGWRQTVGELSVECVLHAGARSVWVAHAQDSPSGFVCCSVDLAVAPSLEAVLWALYSVDERLAWDHLSFTAYEQLRGGSHQQSSGALADVLYCRMVPPMWGMTARDLVQERFLMELPGEADGYAILMTSCSDAAAVELGRPPLPEREVRRATTLLSGYMLRPMGDGNGVSLLFISQMDVGGSFPNFVQRLAKKTGKQEPLEWAQRLEDYVNRRTSETITRFT